MLSIVLLVCSVLLRVRTTSAVSVTIPPEDSEVCSPGPVTFTCTVDRGVGLEWRAEPFVTGQQNRIVFAGTSSLETSPIINVTSSGVTFHAVLTQSDPIPGSGGFFTLQSTLSTTASATTNGTVIVCREPFSGESDSVTLQLQAPPPPPSGVQYSAIVNGISNVTGDIEWNSPMDSSFENFTITVSSLDGPTDPPHTVPSSPLSNITLNYNTHYNISVRAKNCAGSSTSDVLYMISGCPAPSEPVNGGVSGFMSASVGSEVTYHCNTGLTLVGERVAMCSSDLVWVPNGSEVMCQQPLPGDCVDPGELTNGMVIFHNETGDGSVITFQCDPGLSLVGDRVSQCRSGQWTVLPQDVLCTADTNITTGSVEPTSSVAPTSSVEPTGSSPQSAALSAGAIAGIVVVVLFAISLGALLFVIAFITCKTRQSRKTSLGNGATGENSYIPEGDVVELQQMHDPTAPQIPASYSTLQASQENGQYSTPVVNRAVMTTTMGLQYADLGPSSNHSAIPPVATQGKIQYSTVDHTQKAPPEPVAGPALHPLDRDINPELIQRQIRELRPQWRSFGSAAGLPHQFLDEVHSSYTDNKDRLAEVVYEWCGRVRPITWSKVAGTCRKIGCYDLADTLEKAYDTGVLPFRDDEKLPLTPSSKDLPPPLPPRGDSDGTPPPELPPPPPPDALDDLPSRPPKPSTRHESPAAKAPVAPPRPPKSSTKPHPPPRT